MLKQTLWLANVCTIDICAYRSTSANFARNPLIAHTDSLRNLHGCAPTEAWLPVDNLLDTPWKSYLFYVLALISGREASHTFYITVTLCIIMI